MTALQPHGLATLVFAAVVFAVFVWDRLPIATVCLGILALLPLGFALFPLPLASGTLDAMRFFAGFGNPALVAICALMVMGHGLVVTGALEPAARALGVWVARSPRLALLAVMVGAASASGVVNDTPVVVLLIPLLLTAARQAKASATTMLLPMNYAVLIGGMATTIGTSTNLIVVALAASLGVAPLAMFGHFPLVALAAGPALAYLWLVAPRLLAGVEGPDENLSEEVFDAEIRIAEGSRFEGRKLREAMEIIGSSEQLVALRRGDVAMARLPSAILRADDRIVVRDTAQRLKEIEARLDAKLHHGEEEVQQRAAEDGNKKADKETSACRQTRASRRGGAVADHAAIAAGRPQRAPGTSGRPLQHLRRRRAAAQRHRRLATRGTGGPQRARW